MNWYGFHEWGVYQKPATPQ